MCVNNDDCHSNTNKLSSVLFIYSFDIVEDSTLNADVQYFNDMQMMRKEEKKTVHCFVSSHAHTHLHILGRTKRDKETTDLVFQLDYSLNIIILILSYIYRRILLIYRLVNFLYWIKVTVFVEKQYHHK